LSFKAFPTVQAQKAQQILRFAAQADLKILDPISTTAYITRNHGYLVYDTLFGTDENSEVRPQMVDRTSVSPDGMKFTFTLRDGLKWHDGQPVTFGDRDHTCVNLYHHERRILNRLLRAGDFDVCS
jgi:peptide/nickel transport system substrate-binding protein